MNLVQEMSAYGNIFMLHPVVHSYLNYFLYCNTSKRRSFTLSTFLLCCNCNCLYNSSSSFTVSQFS